MVEEFNDEAILLMTGKNKDGEKEPDEEPDDDKGEEGEENDKDKDESYTTPTEEPVKDEHQESVEEAHCEKCAAFELELSTAKENCEKLSAEIEEYKTNIKKHFVANIEVLPYNLFRLRAVSAWGFQLPFAYRRSYTPCTKRTAQS